MKLLLDTHAVLWWLAGDRRLSRGAAAAIADPDNAVFVSVVSGYEIGLKVRRGNLTTAIPREFPLYLDRAGIPALALDMGHMIEGALLAWDHRDPWDRLLAAQARLHGCTLVSVDPIFDALGLARLW
ncbi:MAG: type II toxin-antitoxin system VapC family toxin [Rhodospirillales bacterium]